MEPENTSRHREGKRASYGISWLIAGIVLLLMGLIALGGGYAFTFLSIPLLITALIVGSKLIRIISICLLIIALSSTWSLYEKEREYWRGSVIKTR